MGKYIFLTGQYLPRPGATGICIHQIAKEAVLRGHDVTTICYSDGDNEVQWDGVKTVKIKAPGFLNFQYKSNRLKKILYHLVEIAHKLWNIRKYPLKSKKLVNSYIKALKKHTKKTEAITVVASYTPLEAVVAAAKIKQKQPQFVEAIYYCADTLSNEKGESAILSSRYRSECGIKWEKELFSKFDKILIMECHKEHYLCDIFDEFSKKIKLVNFPLLVSATNQSELSESSTIKIVYAGTLYRKLRNPEFICNILNDLSERIALDVNFIGGGDCDDILSAFELKSNGTIKRKGMLPHEIALQYIGSADVLLSIGNAKSPMAPSKIFEYISTGKPIIHLYTYEKDPCLEPLTKYENALLIQEGDSEAQDKIYDFIMMRKYLSYENIKDKFLSSTPKYTMDIIEAK